MSESHAPTTPPALRVKASVALCDQPGSPRLYVAIGLSGKLNHLIGLRSAGTILAVNSDVTAPVFQGCDIGIVGDWRDVVPMLTTALSARSAALLSHL